LIPWPAPSACQGLATIEQDKNMTPKLRILALAAMGWGAALSAQATVMTFETLAIEARDSEPTPYGTPLLLTNQISGFSFTGATVYHVDQTTHGEYASVGYPKPERKAENGDGFIQNRDGVNLATTYQTISLRLTGALANDDIETFSFDFAKDSATVLDVWAFGKDANGKDVSKQYIGNAGASSWEWGFQNLDALAGLGQVNRIDFVVQAPTTFVRAFALDNLTYTLAGTGGGGSVPEPAGLGLVVLALAAAGLTSRNRRA
jgi:hypothetical protein